MALMLRGLPSSLSRGPRLISDLSRAPGAISRVGPPSAFTAAQSMMSQFHRSMFGSVPDLFNPIGPISPFGLLGQVESAKNANHKVTAAGTDKSNDTAVTRFTHPFSFFGPSFIGPTDSMMDSVLARTPTQQAFLAHQDGGQTYSATQDTGLVKDETGASGRTFRSVSFSSNRPFMKPFGPDSTASASATATASVGANTTESRPTELGSQLPASNLGESSGVLGEVTEEEAAAFLKGGSVPTETEVSSAGMA